MGDMTVDPIDRAILELELAGAEIREVREVRELAGQFLEVVVKVLKEQGPGIAGALVRAALEAAGKELGRR